MPHLEVAAVLRDVEQDSHHEQVAGSAVLDVHEVDTRGVRSPSELLAGRTARTFGG